MAAKKKKTTKRSSSSGGSAAAPRKRRKSNPAKYIPSAGASVGLAIANKDILMNVVNDPFSGQTYKNAINQAIQPDRLRQDAINAAIGYGVGYVVKSYAPKAIKEPLGKIAKKIPRVI